MKEPTLFDRSERVTPTIAQQLARPIAAQPRLRLAQRNPVEFHTASIDELLDQDHPARAGWQAVCHLDLTCLVNTVVPSKDKSGVMPPIHVFCTHRGSMPPYKPWPGASLGQVVR